MVQRRKQIPYGARKYINGHMVNTSKAKFHNWDSDVEWVKPKDTSKQVNTAWRKAVLGRDGYTCQHCGSTENLHAHHILGRAGQPELAEDVDNGIVLCAECHKRFHQPYGYTGFNAVDFAKYMKYD